MNSLHRSIETYPELRLVGWYRLAHSQGSTDVGLSMISLVAVGMLILCLMPATPLRTAARLSQCKNNLKQLGLALHNYHDDFKYFPLAHGGAPPHSWRIDLLPYLDQSALFHMYDLQRAWNEDPNTELALLFLQPYQCPSDPNPKNRAGQYFTAYAAAVGPEGVFREDRTLRLDEITDGTSQTIMIVEACGKQIIWSEPRDLDLTSTPQTIQADPALKSSTGLFSSPHNAVANALFADGSVRAISVDTEPHLLKRLMTADQGDILGDEF